MGFAFLTETEARELGSVANSGASSRRNALWCWKRFLNVPKLIGRS